MVLWRSERRYQKILNYWQKQQVIKNVFEKCDINAYGGYNKGNAVEFLISESMMRWLLEQGADINYVDTYGYTSLLYHAGYTYAEEQVI